MKILTEREHDAAIETARAFDYELPWSWRSVSDTLREYRLPDLLIQVRRVDNGFTWVEAFANINGAEKVVRSVKIKTE